MGLVAHFEVLKMFLAGPMHWIIVVCVCVFVRVCVRPRILYL